MVAAVTQRIAFVRGSGRGGVGRQRDAMKWVWVMMWRDGLCSGGRGEVEWVPEGA